MKPTLADRLFAYCSLCVALLLTTGGFIHAGGGQLHPATCGAVFRGP